MTRGWFRKLREDACPNCGAPKSHGLPGNPSRRSVPPCMKPKPGKPRGAAS